MKRKEIGILASDIEVPAVVRKKADAAFARIKKEDAMKKTKCGKGTETGQNNKILKYIKPVIAAAACAALVLGIGFGSRVGKDPGHEAGTARESGESESVPVTDDFAPGNMFTMTAYAKELEPGKPVPMTSVGTSGQSCVMGGGEDSVNYCIGTEFLCEGENIERVGYSINRGAFQIVQSTDPEERIVVDGQPFDGELNTGMIGGSYDEKLDVQPTWQTSLYQSFILDYDRQSDENTWINICNDCPDDGEIVDMIWGEDATLESRNEGMNRLLGDTVITGTIYYTDGTEQSVEIVVENRIMTYEEAGEPTDEDEIPGDTKSTFITFEVK